MISSLTITITITTSIIVIIIIIIIISWGPGRGGDPDAQRRLRGEALAPSGQISQAEVFRCSSGLAQWSLRFFTVSRIDRMRMPFPRNFV